MNGKSYVKELRDGDRFALSHVPKIVKMDAIIWTEVVIEGHV